MSYDMVRYEEHLPDRPPENRGLPEMAWQFFGFLAIVDRFRQTVRLVRNVFVGEEPVADYHAAIEDLREVVARLGRPQSYEARTRPRFLDRPESTANLTRDEFEDAVRTAIEYIRAGDALQIVPSLRLEVDFDGDPFAVYRSLRLVNPSPFLFYVRQPDLAIVGSSPELMTRARDGIATSRPIAGTRPRGRTPSEDDELEHDLLGDPKERAEHVMLVDLARNDLGRVCEYATVEVGELMVVERYSHVMHIVSEVSGTLREGVGPVDLLRATFPHGTVSGAPKVRAMEIIDELEPNARGPYAGAVGYLDFRGNIDTAIALRTLVTANGKAWVQAGAGVVADSDPAREYEECMDKAAAVLAAIEGGPGCLRHLRASATWRWSTSQSCGVRGSSSRRAIWCGHTARIHTGSSRIFSRKRSRVRLPAPSDARCCSLPTASCERHCTFSSAMSASAWWQTRE